MQGLEDSFLDCDMDEWRSICLSYEENSVVQGDGDQFGKQFLYDVVTLQRNDKLLVCKGHNCHFSHTDVGIFGRHECDLMGRHVDMLTKSRTKFCYICEKKSGTIQEHKLHMKASHNQFLVVACKVCGRWFSDGSKVEAHRAETHIE